MKNILIAAIFALLLGVSSAHSQTITNFGTGSFTTDAFTNFSTVNQSASNVNLIGSDNQILSGSISAINLTAFSGNDLTVFGSMATTPASTFSVSLLDGSSNFASYSGGSWNDLLSSGSTTLSLDSDAGFDWSNVTGVFLSGDGAGDSINTTLSGLSLVPEPSTFAALSGLFALGWVMLRRRRA